MPLKPLNSDHIGSEPLWRGKTIRALESQITLKFRTALKHVVLILLALTMISMVQGDRKKRVMDCASDAGEGAIFLKEFVVSLPRKDSDEPQPMYREPVLLRGNNVYRFNICNDKGRAIISLYDNSRMFISSYQAGTNRNYNPINFLCRKTGTYYIVVTFKNGRAGETVAIMSHVVK